jgi:hypothetical protein
MRRSPSSPWRPTSGRSSSRRSIPRACGSIARTPEQLRDYAAVNAANWDPPDPEVRRFYAAAMPVLLAADSPIWLYVGYLGERPVAAAELTVGGGVAGLYGISTLAPNLALHSFDQ